MVKHIMKDGRVLSDIKDHVVKAEEAKEVYQLIDRINEERRKNGHQV